MSRQWVRLYTDLRHSAKIQRLPDHLFRFTINCWCLTGASTDECLPPTDEIAFELRIDLKICQAYIDYLIEQNVLIRRKGSGKVVPKNWDDRQFVSDSATDRTRKYRERLKKSVMKRHSDAVVTVQDSDSDSDSEQIQTQTINPIAQSRRKTSLSAEQSVWFSEFWSAYWRRIGRGAAETSFARSVTTRQGFDRVMSAIALQAPWMVQRDSDKRPYPATWLNQKRWEDDPDVSQVVDGKTRNEISRGQILIAGLERRGF
jgi:hypothetical protein